MKLPKSFLKAERLRVAMYRALGVPIYDHAFTPLGWVEHNHEKATPEFGLEREETEL